MITTWVSKSWGRKNGFACNTKKRTVKYDLDNPGEVELTGSFTFLKLGAIWMEMRDVIGPNNGHPDFLTQLKDAEEAVSEMKKQSKALLKEVKELSKELEELNSCNSVIPDFDTVNLMKRK